MTIIKTVSIILTVTRLIILLNVFQLSEACNEHVCASIVSKCMLTQSCKCDIQNNATCARDCFVCLDYLYSECCSCLEMCPDSNSTSNMLSTKSHVEDLDSQSAELFSALTEEEDVLERWVSHTYTIQMSFIVSSETQPKEVIFEPGTKVTMKTDGKDTEEDITVNCTVAYMTQCMSWNKCKSSCRSMGSASYRWFHDGCCECIGSNCINYGINKSRCSRCPIIHINKEEEPSLASSNSIQETSSRQNDYDVSLSSNKAKESQSNDEINKQSVKIDEKNIELKEESLNTPSSKKGEDNSKEPLDENKDALKTPKEDLKDIDAKKI